MDRGFEVGIRVDVFTKRFPELLNSVFVKLSRYFFFVKEVVINGTDAAAGEATDIWNVGVEVAAFYKQLKRSLQDSLTRPEIRIRTTAT